MRIKNETRLAAAGLAALLAGVLNGYIGTGGGIVVVAVLNALYKDDGIHDKKDVFASAVASILPMSVLSAVIYTVGEEQLALKSLSYLLPAAVGGAAGGFLLDRLNTVWLVRIFAVVMAVSGAIMVRGALCG